MEKHLFKKETLYHYHKQEVPITYPRMVKNKYNKIKMLVFNSRLPWL